MDDYIYNAASFNRWANKRRSDPQLIEDAERVARWTPPIIEKQLKEQTKGKKHTANSKRGRPELSTPNPVASYMHLLSYNRPHWLDSIVYGSVATGAGSSNGKLNVSPKSVIGALHLRTISTGALKTPEMSLRTAQTIAKAARHAAHGIDSYLARHPEIKERLALELASE
ncbi:hypothetical protein [Pseudomonas lundensis]|uniref:hypothetical protein n=1 Tax=Pseudomonas lundensis TaxID=86185 RepID=UPI00114053C7|nr:hypothetical protein [Pseudomonas lundensis]